MGDKKLKNKIGHYIILGVIVLFSVFVFMYIRQYTYNNGEIKDIYTADEKNYIPVDNSTVITQSFSSDAELFRALVVEFSYGADGLGMGAVNVTLQDQDTGEVLSTYSLSATFIASGESALIGFPEAISNDKGSYVVTLTFENFQEGIYLNMAVTDKDDPAGELTVNDMPMAQDLIMGVSVAGKDNSYVLIHVVYAIIIAAIIITYLMFFVVNDKKKIKTEFVYLASGLLLGIAFSLTIPIMVAPDEPVHLYKAYDLSNEILGVDDADTVPIMMRLSDYNKEYQYMGLDRSYMNDYLEGTLEKPDDTEIVQTYFLPAFTYDYLYYPSALGITVGRLLGLSTNLIYLLGRFFNTIVFVLAVFYAIRKIPFGKGVVFIWAMLPIMLQQTNSFSYDCVVNSLSILVISLTLNLLYGEKDVKKWQITKIIVLVLSCVLLFPCKGHALLPIVVLPLMILAKYLKDNKKTIFERISKLKIWIKVVAGVLIVGFVGVCMVYALRIYSNLTLPENINNSVIPWNGENGYTVGYFLKNPFALASIFINTVWMKSDGYLVGLLGGNLGWLNIPIPYIFIIPYAIILILASFRKEDEEQLLTVGNKIWMWFVFAAVCALAMLGMLISWTPASYKYIEGVQGRYFLPGLVLLFLGLRTKKACIGKDTDKILMFLSVFMSLFVVTAVFKNIL